VALKVTFNLTAERKRETSNIALVQPTKKGKVERAKASLQKERQAKASINTTDTLLTGGTQPPVWKDLGIIRKTTHNGTPHMTKANGQATTRAKTPKGKTRAEGEVGTMGTSPATTTALTPIFIKTLLTLMRRLIHPLSPSGRILHPITGLTRTTLD
jgi:hypothetical protein